MKNNKNLEMWIDVICNYFLFFLFYIKAKVRKKKMRMHQNFESWFSQNKSKLFAKQSKNSVFLISINLQLSIPALFCIRHRSKRAMSAFEVSNFLFTLWNRWTKSCENCQIFEWSNSRGELRYFPHSDVMYSIFSKIQLKSVHFKKTVAQISFLSKLWYFLFWFVLKVPQFWKKRDSRNCLLKMNGF